MTHIESGGVAEVPLAYSINDAANKLGLGRTTIYELFDGGKLSYVKIGKRRLVEHSELVRFLTAHRVAA